MLPAQPRDPATLPQLQDLYVAVTKATLAEEVVPKEKHVRSECGRCVRRVRSLVHAAASGTQSRRGAAAAAQHQM